MSENHEFIKAVSGGLAAGAINHYLSYGSDMNPNAVRRSAMFAGVVGAGLLASSMIAPGLAAQQGSNTHWISAKTLEHRVIEVGVGTGTVVLVNNYVYRTSGLSMIQTAGLVFAADFIGEYIADYATAQPLSYFA
jgi:multisubunit Na+/H+ antiporter MnhB subunit